MRTGGQILIDALVQHGVDTVFGVPGESFLGALDAMYERRNAVSFLICRQEGGAAFMADAYAKLTGKPGVVFVTRGPGACNASIGVHTAFQDSTPMLVLIGQVGRTMREREAFQEVEFRHMYAPLAKWVCEVQDPDRLPEFVARAMATARAGRPGPVVLALPEDVLTGSSNAADCPPAPVAMAAPDPELAGPLRDLLAAAERPLLVVGGSGWSAETGTRVAAWAASNGVPIANSLRCQDYIDNDHPNYIGDLGIGANPPVARRLKEADLVIALGPRLGEMTTAGYTLMMPPLPVQKLVHVHAGAEELGSVYHPTLAFNAVSERFARLLMTLPPVAWEARRAWLEEARADYLRLLDPPPQPGPLDMGDVMRVLRTRMPRDSILCNGAGNYTGWVHKFWQFHRYRSQLAPTAGAMGYGVPAAVAAAHAAPGRQVVAFAGDGCFLMTGQELATAVQYGLKLLILVIDNGMYGTIRMHQEREYPERVYGTDLVNPDFAALARAYGAHGEQVTETAGFAPALDRALAATGPAVMHLIISSEAITARRTLSQIRDAALKSRAGHNN